MAATLEAPASPSPEIAVLANSPALHALKRPQLVSLCKHLGIKAAGKNVDLIEKLKAHGESLNCPPAAPTLDLSEDASGEAPAAAPAEGDISTTWSLISPSAAPSASDVRTLAEFGTQDSLSKSISQSSSSHSLSSTLRSSSTSIFSGLNTLASKFQPDLRSPSLSLSLDEPAPIDSPRPPAIRFVDSETPSSHPIPAKTTLVARLAPATPPPTTPAFVFGSPLPTAAPEFTFGSQHAGQNAFGSTSEFVFGGQGAEGKTAAERVREELERRLRESRGAGGTGTGSVDLSASARALSVEKEGKKGAFDGKHKREFDKMDSIANHYAAKRPLSHSTSTALATSAADRSAKRLKLPSAPLARSPEKKLVDALRDSGWAAESKPSTLGVTFGASIRSKASGTLGKSVMREGLVPNDGREEREREERKRKLEMAKARRMSAVGGAQGGRRRSLVVNPQKATGNMASRFLKTTLKKLTSSVAPAAKSISPVLQRPAFSTSSVNRPPLASSRPTLASSTASSRVGASTAPKHTFGSGPSRATVVAPGSVKKQPAWKKFDLQKSLARPLNYVPKLGSKSQLSTNNIVPSAPSAKFRLSTASTSSRAPLKRTSSLSRAGPSPSLSRRPSARVANPDLLGAAKPGQAHEREFVEVTEMVEEEPIEEDAMEEVIEELESEMMAFEEELTVSEAANEVPGLAQDALTAPSTSLAHSTFPSSFPSQPLVSLPSSPAKSPFRPTKPDLARLPLAGITSPPAQRASRSSTAGKKGGSSPGKKIVSSSTRAARDAGKPKVGLETKVRMVKARKGKA